MEKQSFNYRPNIVMFFFTTLLFGGCLYFFIFRGMNNNQGLILNGIIELTVFQATIFYWLFAFFSFLFVIIGAVVLCHRIFMPSPQLIFENDYIKIPGRIFFNKKNTIVNYKDIDKISDSIISGTRIIEFHLKSKKRASITNRMFDSKDDFLKALELIVKIKQNN